MSALAAPVRATKRRRRCPPRQFQAATAAEERFLQQAIENSKIDKGRPTDGKLEVPWGPVFYPTVKDFEGNPLDYVERIRPIAERYGICKIVPPEGWDPRPFGSNLESPKRFETKRQVLHRLQEGISFGDGENYTAEEYQRVSSQRSKEYKAAHYPNHDLLSRHADALCSARDEDDARGSEAGGDSHDRECYTPSNLERDYWKIVETHSEEVVVEYANDIDADTYGSGFPLSERGRSMHGETDPEKVNLPEPEFGTEDYYKETWWNLNNIPCAPDSALRYIKVAIKGVNIPWMYYGSLFTTFCWHNEDNYLYAINYHHRGAPKQWYGVPGSKQASDGLEKVFKSYLSVKMRNCPDLLHHITTMFSPRLLQNADVPCCRLLQHAGEFVVTFPRAFHAGFSYGPNCGEAVNFAPHDWIAHGTAANERYRAVARPAVFSQDRLTCTMANHLSEQKSYGTCKLLLTELERVTREELQLRSELKETGVRDISHLIQLPKNRLDQLDEESANYDDKRLCFACKHICFFSAVGCECSQSKVSCLRHSHVMCRCKTDRRYLMIWTSENELLSTLDRVRVHCNYLKKHQQNQKDHETETKWKKDPLPKVAPGAERNLSEHKNDDIPTQPILSTCA